MNACECPICGTLFDLNMDTFPFCSERCRMVDLGRWLGGDYYVPGEPVRVDDEQDDER